MKLNGAKVLITGGSRGFGFALANQMKQAGAQVTIAARDEVAVTRAA